MSVIGIENAINVKMVNILLLLVVAQATPIRVANLQNQSHHETNQL